MKKLTNMQIRFIKTFPGIMDVLSLKRKKLYKNLKNWQKYHMMRDNYAEACRLKITEYKVRTENLSCFYPYIDNRIVCCKGLYYDYNNGLMSIYDNLYDKYDLLFSFAINFEDIV